MPRIILKSPYMKPNSKTHMDNYVRHIAYHGGVERPTDSRQQLSVTVFQQKVVDSIIKEYPDTTELHEYMDFQSKPTRRNAEDFIIRAAETHPELFGARERYVDYIATRPGVVHIAGHGLFGDSENAVILDRIMNEVADHTGNVWCHIISLRREDAQRLGYDSVEAWQNLLQSQRNTIACAMNIHPRNFRWYAAFHNKEHHPHCHLVAWSSNPKEPWLSEEGILKIKSALARQIFKNDLMQIYDRQTKYRDTLRQDSREIAAEIIRQINGGGYENPTVENLLFKLAERLDGLSGKKAYGYLPADVKAIVDRIVDTLAENDHIAQLYHLWYEEKFETLRTYTDTMPEKLPLSQNKAFKPIKNIIIEEAQNILLQRLTFEDSYTDEPADEFVPELVEPEPVDPKLTDEKEESAFSLYRRAKELLDKDSPQYDPQEAVSLLIRSAQQDSDIGTPFGGIAAYRLGKIFLMGDPVEQDVGYGLKWLWQSQEQNNPYAQLLLGRTYLKGDLVAKDISLAETLFGLSAKQENAHACYALAKLHLSGLAENSSVTKAVHLLEVSANKGNQWAQYTLGKMLMRGELIAKDIPRAEKLLLSAARPRSAGAGSEKMNGSNPYAGYLLGKLYLSEDGIPKNAEKAVYYLKDSAKQGNQWAQYQLGKMLLYGKEAEQNTKEGLDLLSQSAQQGNMYAQKILDGYECFQGHRKTGAMLGSMRLLGHLSRLIQNRLEEEDRCKDNAGRIDRKLRRQIEIKREAHGLRLGG